jgi:sigma-B regulation protein RsbU (phosphoserine phosphatase)
MVQEPAAPSTDKLMAEPVLVVAHWPDAKNWQTLVDAALTDWPGQNTPPIRTIDTNELAKHLEPIPGVTAAWLIAPPGVKAIELYQVVDQLAAWQIPVALTRPDETMPIGSVYQTGTVIAPADAPTGMLRLLLAALVSQGELIAQMKQELTITRMHHGGLRGQMDKLDEEMRLAATVQREFLPRHLPSIGAVQAWTLFRPASYVSGDIYDVQRLDQHHIGFWIADVVGHGVPAALMTMFVKRALSNGNGNDIDGSVVVPPDEALSRLNHEMVAREGGGNRFATACYGLIDCRNFELQIARAGHPLPMWLHADGAMQMLEPDGPLLGVFPDEQFELLQFRLSPGDRLLIYSDGFEQAFGNGEQRDLKAYVGEFDDLRHGRPQEALGRLQAKLDAQPGSLHQEDDLTVIMIAIDAETAVEDPSRNNTIVTALAS